MIIHINYFLRISVDNYKHLFIQILLNKYNKIMIILFVKKIKSINNNIINDYII